MISPAVRELLATRIDTFEKLDLVVALAAAPHQSLSIEALAETLNCPRLAIRQAVAELRRVMLVDVSFDGEVKLVPLTEEDRRVVAELLEVYGQDRSVVVRLLGELAMARIRGMAAKAFSDAFVIKGKKGGRDG